MLNYFTHVNNATTVCVLIFYGSTPRSLAEHTGRIQCSLIQAHHHHNSQSERLVGGAWCQPPRLLNVK